MRRDGHDNIVWRAEVYEVLLLGKELMPVEGWTWSEKLPFLAMKTHPSLGCETQVIILTKLPVIRTFAH